MIIDKLFKENAYGVAIRPVNSNLPYSTKYPTIFNWYADPFPVSTETKDYLFVEIMNYHVVYGQIAVAEILGGKITSFRKILSEPFHMSFPNVFKYCDTYYMIPETYQARQVRLYKCEKFPYDWRLEKVLLQNVELVDHALYFLDDTTMIMLSLDISVPNRRVTRVYTIDMEKRLANEVKPHGQYTQERAGGTIFQYNGFLFRAIQVLRRLFKNIQIGLHFK